MDKFFLFVIIIIFGFLNSCGKTETDTKSMSYPIIEGMLNTPLDPVAPIINPVGEADTFSFTSDNLPDGLSLSIHTGKISGVPKIVGSNSFTVQAVVNGNSYNIIETDVTIFIKAKITLFSYPNALPGATAESIILEEKIRKNTSLTPITNPPGAVGVYSYTGLLPDGISFNTNTGEISGMPIKLGKVPFFIQFEGTGEYYLGKVEILVTFKVLDRDLVEFDMNSSTNTVVVKVGAETIMVPTLSSIQEDTFNFTLVSKDSYQDIGGVFIEINGETSIISEKLGRGDYIIKAVGEGGLVTKETTLTVISKIVLNAAVEDFQTFIRRRSDILVMNILTSSLYYPLKYSLSKPIVGRINGAPLFDNDSDNTIVNGLVDFYFYSNKTNDTVTISGNKLHVGEGQGAATYFIVINKNNILPDVLANILFKNISTTFSRDNDGIGVILSDGKSAVLKSRHLRISETPVDLILSTEENIPSDQHLVILINSTSESIISLTEIEITPNLLF